MMNYKLNQNIFQSFGTVEFRFFEPPREMEIGSKNQEVKNRRWHQIRPVLPWNGFIRSKKADNNGISLLLMCEPSLFTNKTCI